MSLLRILQAYFIWSEGEMDLEYCVKKPGKMKYAFTGNGASQVTIYNNGKAVRYLNGKKDPISKEDILKLKRDIHIYPLAFIDSLDATAVFQGKKEFNKQKCYSVMIEYPFGPEESYFNCKTQLLVGCFSPAQKATVVYYDFRETDGLNYPYKSKYIYADGHTALSEITSIELNKNYPDEYFEIK